MIDCRAVLELIDFHVPDPRLRQCQLFQIPINARRDFILNFSVFKFYKLYTLRSTVLDLFNMSLSDFKRACLC